MSHSQQFFQEAAGIARQLDYAVVDRIAGELAALRERGGRLFFLGVGGSAGNCSHAVNDFRKLCGIETYSPIDNVSELTARTNDEGWETVFAAWLRGSRINDKDAVFVLSVGGGDAERNVSANLVLAIKEANVLGIPVVAILDSNVSPEGISFPVPANDDASRAIRLYCDAIAQAAKKGGHQAVVQSGVDIGALDVPEAEEVAAVAVAEVGGEA